MVLNIKNNYILLPINWKFEIINGNMLEIRDLNNKLCFTYCFEFSTSDVKISLENNKIIFNNINLEKKFLNLYKVLFNNFIIGINMKFNKTLIISGVGFKFQISNSSLVIFAGYAKPSYINIPHNIEITLENPNKIVLLSTNKQELGIFAAKIKSIKTIEPYKLKGIKYEHETIKQKNYKKIK